MTCHRKQRPQIFAFTKADWIAVEERIVQKTFSPYCFSELLRQWYKWVWGHIKENIPIVTRHRSSLPPWTTSETSHEIKKLKTLQQCQALTSRRKLSLAIRIKRKQKEVDNALEYDLCAFEENVFAGRRFSDFQKFLSGIRRSHSMPNKMYWNNREATTDREKTEVFNDYFINVFQLTGSFSPDDDISFPLSIANSVKVDENKVVNFISKLNANSAMGPEKMKSGNLFASSFELF